MEKETAKKAWDLLIEIEGAKKNIEKINKTKEFCKIKLEGEDGIENKHSYEISYTHQKELVVLLRETALRFLQEKLKELEQKLSSL